MGKDLVWEVLADELLPFVSWWEGDIDFLFFLGRAVLVRLVTFLHLHILNSNSIYSIPTP
jgi:hypothetical protein